MATPAELVREGTMQVTAKEGIGFLQSQGAHSLLQRQGLVGAEASTAAQNGGVEVDIQPATNDIGLVPREGTMQVTAREGADFIAREEARETRVDTATTSSTTSPFGSLSSAPNSSVQREETVSISSFSEVSKSPALSPAKSPAAPREGTMQATAREGVAFLASQPSPAKHEQVSPKPVANREGTMQVTAREGAAFLASQTTPKKDSGATTSPKPSPAREGTMEVTAREGAAFLAAQTTPTKQLPSDAPKPSPQREGMMEVTAREGAAFLASQASPKQNVSSASPPKASASQPSPQQSPSKLSREGTMQVTAREGAAFLASADAKNQKDETSPGKPLGIHVTSNKPALSPHRSPVVHKTLASPVRNVESAAPSSDSTSGPKTDNQQPSILIQTPPSKKAVRRSTGRKSGASSTLMQNEAAEFLGSPVDTSSGRTLRKRSSTAAAPVPTPPKKRARTSAGGKRGRPKKNSLPDEASPTPAAEDQPSAALETNN